MRSKWLAPCMHGPAKHARGLARHVCKSQSHMQGPGLHVHAGGSFAQGQAPHVPRQAHGADPALFQTGDVHQACTSARLARSHAGMQHCFRGC